MSAKLHIETTGGSSPSVIVSGNREDLAALADAIKSGSLPAWGFPAVGSAEAITFRTVGDVNSLLQKEKRKTKSRLMLASLFWLLLAGMLFLAYVGAKSLI